MQEGAGQIYKTVLWKKCIFFIIFGHQKTLKDTKRHQKTTQDIKRHQKTPKDTKRYQKISCTSLDSMKAVEAGQGQGQGGSDEG